MKCGLNESLCDVAQMELLEMWLKLKFNILKSHLKLDMGNTCGCSEDTLAVERTNELDCSNVFSSESLEQTDSYEESTKEKTANQ